jgi:hypothetical protein
MEAFAPIPPPRLDDDEDVNWALSTAGALWARGERTEALKWLRRAAEQASDVNADIRALELFKAAAEVANKVGSGSAPPPPPPPPSVPAPAPPVQARPSAPPPPPRRPPPSLPPRPAGSVAPPPSNNPATPPPSNNPYPATPPPSNNPVTTGSPVGGPYPARPPSIPAPPIPRTAHASQIMAPPPAPARPPPPVAAPSRPVAISAKVNVPPQALAPKRRRSFTGEARPADKARGAEPARTGGGTKPRPAQADGKHRRGRTPEEEQHDEVLAADARSFLDDLDEDTRVLSTKRGTGDDLDRAFEKLRNEPVHEGAASPKHRAQPVHDEQTDSGTSAPSSARTSPNTAGWRPPPESQAGRSSPSEPLAERPSAGARGAAISRAVPAPRRFDTLSALRVAVLATTTPGEVRLIALDAADEAPPGAALAVLVPLSAADGESVVKLFGAIE